MIAERVGLKVEPGATQAGLMTMLASVAGNIPIVGKT